MPANNQLEVLYTVLSFQSETVIMLEQLEKLVAETERQKFDERATRARGLQAELHAQLDAQRT